MPLYRYKAVAESGETVEGEMEAPNQAAVVRRLQTLGHIPIRAETAIAGKTESFLRRDLFARRQASPRDVALLTREMATLVQAGLPLDRSFEILIELTDERVVKGLLERILDAVRGGATLADALAAQDGIFPRYYVSMVQAGEAGGTLDTVLACIADFMERAQTTREQVRSALIYPIILVAMAILAIVVLLTVVVPRFRPMFEDAGKSLPISTQIIVGLGDIMVAYWWLIAAVLAVAVLIARALFRQPPFRYRWDRWILAWPLLGDVVVKAEVARFARTLGTLLDNGVNMLRALSLSSSTVGNKALARELEAVADSVKQGKSLTEPLIASGLFPKLAIQLTRVGEETGELDQMLLKIADIYDQETGRTIERMMALLVPILTIVLGLLIAGIIGSILAAILSVYQLPY